MHCDASGKTCHKDKAAGLMHLKNLERRRQKSGGSVYCCPHCGYYHITKSRTKSLKDYKKYKQREYEKD